MTKKPDLETVKAASGLLRIVFWALIATALVQGYLHGIDMLLMNLVLAVLVQQFRFEVLTLGSFGVVMSSVKAGIGKAKLAALNRKPEDKDPFDDPFGDMPGIPGKDSDNEKGE